MDVKIKLVHPEAKMPTYGTSGAGAFDFYAVGVPEWGVALNPRLPYYIFETGVQIEVPKDHVLLMFSRSGQGFNHNVTLSNCVGVIDSDYRGNLRVKLSKNHLDFDAKQDPDAVWDATVIYPGDRIAQGIIIPYPKINFQIVDQLSDTVRGTGAYGSTGA